MRIGTTNLLQIDTKITQNNIATGTNMQAEDIIKVDRPLIAERELASATNTANNRLEGYNRKLEFSIHEKTGDIMIKVLDTLTNEVVREIPPEKIKDMIANMLERAGLLVDERA